MYPPIKRTALPSLKALLFGLYCFLPHLLYSQSVCGPVNTFYQTVNDGVTGTTAVFAFNPYLSEYIRVGDLQGIANTSGSNSAYNINTTLVYSSEGGLVLRVYDPGNGFSYVGDINITGTTENFSNNLFSENDHVGYIKGNTLVKFDVSGVGSYPANLLGVEVNLSQSANASDYIMLNEKVFGLNGGLFYIIDSNTGTVNIIPLSVVGGTPGSSYGAAWQDINKNLYVYNNDDNGIYKIDNVELIASSVPLPTMVTLTKIFDSKDFGANDGFGCELQFDLDDSDGDGVSNAVDLDLDNDGILNSGENQGADPNLDNDLDGVIALLDDDDSNNAIGNVDGLIEWIFDVDGDQIPNAFDLDSDNDGIVDNIEAQSTSSYIPPIVDDPLTVGTNEADIDGDGLNEAYEGSGNQGLFTINSDSSLLVSDAQPDYLDADSDNDGEIDQIEAYDLNGDNIADTLLSGTDSDFDGIDDAVDRNLDGPSAPEAATNDGQLPTDFPNDEKAGGDPDWREIGDYDGDLNFGPNDLDKDNDGLPDLQENYSPHEPFGDSDGDGLSNFKDVENRGFAGDGSITDYSDANADGVPDVYDNDADGVVNHLDLDSDNDGIFDLVELGHGALDANADGRLDAPVFGDGIPNSVQNIGQENSGTINYVAADSDGDTINDFVETDADNDLCLDVTEGGFSDPDTDGILGSTPVTVDSNGKVNSAIDGYSLPLDTDGNSVLDFSEIGPEYDTDGIANSCDIDDDADGNPDTTDLNPTTPTAQNDELRLIIPNTLGINLLLNDDFLPIPGTTVTDLGTGNTTGVVVLNAGTGMFTYTPAAGESGIRYIHYQVCHNSGVETVCDTATVWIVILKDTDTDGIVDSVDIDDDNDGVLDLNETILEFDFDSGVQDWQINNANLGFNIIPFALSDQTLDPSTGCALAPIPTSRISDTHFVTAVDDLNGVAWAESANNLNFNASAAFDRGTLEFEWINGDFDGVWGLLDTELNLQLDGAGISVNAQIDISGRVNQGWQQLEIPLKDVLWSGTASDLLAVLQDLDQINIQIEAVSGEMVSTEGCTGAEYYGLNWVRIIVDSDGDGVENRLDPDSDSDGISDLYESRFDGLTFDADNNAIPDDLTDIDSDGLMDVFDASPGNPSPIASIGQIPVNSDADPFKDLLDLDSDNDGLPDNIEGQTTASYQTPAYVDSDGDGIDDTYDALVGFGGSFFSIANTDSTDNPDFRDEDADNDQIEDINENGNATNFVSGSDVDSDGLDNNFDFSNDQQVPLNANNSISDINGTFLGDLDADLLNDGSNAIPLTINVDFRDASTDRGDAPDIYGTLAASNGPVHQVRNDLLLGATIDDDMDGFFDATDNSGNASDDDTEGSAPDDEDGVSAFPEIFNSDNSYQLAFTCINNTGGQAYVGAWLDFDMDGNFGATEFANTTVANGSTGGVLVWTDLSPGATLNVGKSYVRIRLASQPINAFQTGGFLTDGEVEDYEIEILSDIDRDQIRDEDDEDSNNNGIADVVENNGLDPGEDKDGDGVPALIDDDDNDPLTGDADGMINTLFDHDRDGIANFADLDSDNDGIYDVVERGLADYDLDGDGRLEGPVGTNGLLDALEIGGVDGAGQILVFIDTDNDGVANYLDLDSDNDGIPDNIEAQRTVTYVAPSEWDIDSNGVNDAYDTNGTPLNPVNTDEEDQPDYLDDDSDNDTVPDRIEGNDFNSDGQPDFVLLNLDTDGDGLDDAFETNDINDYFNPNEGINSPLDYFPNTDSSEDLDYRDTDDDGDGIATMDEDVNADGDLLNDDADFDGQVNYLDWDTLFGARHLVTPNGNGLNDGLMLSNIEFLTPNRVEIYNRWGVKVWETNDYNNSNNFFEGRFNKGIAGLGGDRILPSGVYYYLAFYTNTRGVPQRKTGFFYLIQ